MPNRSNQRCCTVLTPEGRGAVAVIGVFGTDAARRVDRLFRSATNKKIADTPGQNLFYGHWISTGEDVVVTRSESRRLEIHCHGGVSAPAAIVRSLVAAGFEEVPPMVAAREMGHSEWTAGLRVALADAATETTAKILLRQLSIAEPKIKELRQGLDSDLSRAVEVLTAMHDGADLGRRLTEPASVVLCGSPNVGKSSLINALAGFDRVIVHETAGTTRDVVTQQTAINGWPVILKDTAGLRTAENEIEEIGIGLSVAEIHKADWVVAVLDATSLPTESEIDLLKQTRPGLIVLNKCDLLKEGADPSVSNSPCLNSPVFMSASREADMLLTSTTTGHGIPELIQKLGDLLTPESIPADVLIPVNDSQRSSVKRALDAAIRGDDAVVKITIEDWL